MPIKNREKRREYNRQWIAKRRADWFAGKSCLVCGSTEELELDHVDPSTKVDHKIWSWSAERRDEEAAKCQVLCHHHHQLKSIAELQRFEHGTENMYDRHGCRCAECRTAVLETWRIRNERKRKRRS